MLLLDYLPLFAEESSGYTFQSVPLTGRQQRRSIITYRLQVLTMTNQAITFDPDEWLVLDDIALS